MINKVLVVEHFSDRGKITPEHILEASGVDVHDNDTIMYNNSTHKYTTEGGGVYSKYTEETLEFVLYSMYSAMKEDYGTLHVFASGPFSFLASMGGVIGDVVGDKNHIRLYREVVDSSGRFTWKWPSIKGSSMDFTWVGPETSRRSKDVILLLNSDRTIDCNSPSIRDIPTKDVYTFGSRVIGINSLRYERGIEEYQQALRDVLDYISIQHGSNVKIHTFGSVAAPLALMTGIHRVQSDPVQYLYDKVGTGWVCRGVFP
jgi:hypothetical protein